MENAKDSDKRARRPTDPPTAPAKVAMLCALSWEDDLTTNIGIICIKCGGVSSRVVDVACRYVVLRVGDNGGWGGEKPTSKQRRTMDERITNGPR